MSRRFIILARHAASSPPGALELTDVDLDVGDPSGAHAGVMTLTGAFDGTESVTIGGSAASSITLVSPTALSCRPPPLTSGTHDIVVTRGAASASLVGRYRAWTPAEISGIDGYLDSRKGLTLVGGRVSVWSSQVNSFGVSQGTADHRPALVEDEFGAGVPALRFDGANDMLMIGAARSLTAPNTSSIFWVGKHTAAPTGVVSYGCSGNVVGDDGGFTAWGIYADGLEAYVFTSVEVKTKRGQGDGLNDGASRLHGWTHGSGVLRAYSGGAQLGSDASVAYSGFSSWRYIGRAWPPAFYAGDLGAVIVVKAVMTETERTRLHKWARLSFGAAA